MHPDKIQYLEELIQELVFADFTALTLENISEKIYNQRHQYLVVFFDGIDGVAKDLEAFLASKMLAHIQNTNVEGGVTQRIKHAVIHRIYAIENGPMVYKALNTYYLRAGKLLSATHAAWNAADSIWHAIGDKSTDWNYYSKRTILSGIYLGALRYAIAGGKDLGCYLEHKLNKIRIFASTKSKLKKCISRIPIVRMFIE